MTPATILDGIKQLSPGEQSEKIRFTSELARKRQLTAKQLGELADRLAESDDPEEIVRLKTVMTRGFYGA